MAEYNAITPAEKRAIVCMLETGMTNVAICRVTGRASSAITKVRKECRMPRSGCVSLLVEIPDVVWRMFSAAAQRRSTSPAQLALEVLGGVTVRGTFERQREAYGVWRLENRAR
jgi:hypothetical protein